VNICNSPTSVQIHCGDSSTKHVDCWCTKVINACLCVCLGRPSCSCWTVIGKVAFFFLSASMMILLIVWYWGCGEEKDGVWEVWVRYSSTDSLIEIELWCWCEMTACLTSVVSETSVVSGSSVSTTSPRSYSWRRVAVTTLFYARMLVRTESRSHSSSSPVSGQIGTLHGLLSILLPTTCNTISVQLLAIDLCLSTCLSITSQYWVIAEFGCLFIYWT